MTNMAMWERAGLRFIPATTRSTFPRNVRSSAIVPDPFVPTNKTWTSLLAPHDRSASTSTHNFNCSSALGVNEMVMTTVIPLNVGNCSCK